MDLSLLFCGSVVKGVDIILRLLTCLSKKGGLVRYTQEKGKRVSGEDIWVRSGLGDAILGLLGVRLGAVHPELTAYSGIIRAGDHALFNVWVG